MVYTSAQTMGGGALIVIALVGMAMNPASRWPWVLATGVIWLLAAWLPRR